MDGLVCRIVGGFGMGYFTREIWIGNASAINIAFLCVAVALSIYGVFFSNR